MSQKGHRSSLFLLELILVIFFFSLASAVCIQLFVKAHLTEQGHQVTDCGTNSTDSCDYPDFARPAAQLVADGTCERGVVLCTTGIGVSIVANKVKGVRCALCHEPLSAEMTRRHNDANVLAMGAGVTGGNLAERILDVFLSTEFEGGRHQRRVDKVMETEN